MGMDLPGTMVFDYPSVAVMTTFLVSLMADRAVEALSLNASAEDESDFCGEDARPGVMVFAAMCHSAGGVISSPDTSSDGAVDSISVVPYMYWDVDNDHVDGKLPGSVAVLFGGFAQDTDKHDYLLF